MGFMDKVKEQANNAAAVAKDAAQKGQAKVDEVQAKRAADGVLRQLGLLAFLSQTDRAPATADADVARHVATLQSFETEHGPLSAE
jgi:hypothetical protein